MMQITLEKKQRNINETRDAILLPSRRTQNLLASRHIPTLNAYSQQQANLNLSAHIRSSSVALQHAVGLLRV